MTNDGRLSRFRDFLRWHNTMTLATVDGQGQPQAAAVFYAVDRTLSLYFLSSPNSRHSCNLQKNARAAATIQADGQDWQAIQGLQVEGEVEQVSGAGAVAQAASIYVARFGFLRGAFDMAAELTEAPNSGVVAKLREALADSRFYVLRPRWFRLIDNTVAFGHKEEVEFRELSAPESGTIT